MSAICLGLSGAAIDQVITQAQAQVPLFVQGQRVEQVQGLVIQAGACFRQWLAIRLAIPVTGWVVQVKALCRREAGQVVGEGVAVIGLAGNFSTRDQRVPQAKGVEVAGKAGLVDPQRGFDLAAIALGPCWFVASGWQPLGVDMGGGDYRFALDPGIA
ncbi:hypothetical protein D3C76_746960 [compost metagenome]